MQTIQRTFAELVQDLQSGDAHAFPELMPLLAPTVNAVVRRFWGSGRLGSSRDDLLQEAWTAVFQALGKYDTERYPHVAYAFFRGAIISRFLTLDQLSPMIGMKRPLKRFLGDVLSGRVDWTLTDTEVTELYPGVLDEDVAWARYSGMARWDVFSIDFFDGAFAYDRSHHNWPSKSIVVESAEDEVDERLDVLALLHRVVGEFSDLERDVFVLRFLEERSRTETSLDLGVSVCVLRRVERDILARCAGSPPRVPKVRRKKVQRGEVVELVDAVSVAPVDMTDD